MTRRRFGNYWTKTSTIEAIKNYLKFKDNNLYSESLDLYNGKSERVSIDRFDNDITEINSKDAALKVLTFLPLLETHYVLKEASTISGRTDIVFIPKGIVPAIIIELKVNKEASGAIKQIKEKKCLDILGSYKGKVMLVGINYDEAYNH